MHVVIWTMSLKHINN